MGVCLAAELAPAAVAAREELVARLAAREEDAMPAFDAAAAARHANDGAAGEEAHGGGARLLGGASLHLLDGDLPGENVGGACGDQREISGAQVELKGDQWEISGAQVELKGD